MRMMTFDKALNWKAYKSQRIGLIASSLVWILLAGLAHYLTGPNYEFHIVFLLPVIVICWYVSIKAGFLTALLSAAVWMAVDWLAAPLGADPQALLVNDAVRLSVFALVIVLVERLRRLHERESALARVDLLTQLPNRRAFHEHAGAEIERAQRYRHPLTIISLDLDNFKSVNDNDGHDAGDRVLRTVAEVLQKNIRSTDVAGRLGGDEFAILLPETGRKAAGEIAVKLQQQLAHHMQKGGWPVTASLGVSTFMAPPASIDDLMKQADMLMYSAKQKGKNRICHEVIQALRDNSA
ncbi:MAG: diguanylate cyclase [Gallionella sp.]|nr:diguanylate cyclase [Gallionella sp.]MDO9448194.1 diguanylate cyclase [Candidatus Nitrotoga sp.]